MDTAICSECSTSLIASTVHPSVAFPSSSSSRIPCADCSDSHYTSSAASPSILGRPGVNRIPGLRMFPDLHNIVLQRIQSFPLRNIPMSVKSCYKYDHSEHITKYQTTMTHLTTGQIHVFDTYIQHKSNIDAGHS